MAVTDMLQHVLGMLPKMHAVSALLQSVWLPYLVAAVLIVFVVAQNLFKAGILTKIDVKPMVLGPYLVLYKTVVGPYGTTAQHCNDLTNTIIKEGLAHKSEWGKKTGVGLFFDDPRVTPGDKCRFAVGWVFKEGREILAKEDLEKHRRWLSALSLVQSGGYKVGYFPSSRCLGAAHPMTGRLALLLAVLRVYPRLNKALDKLKRESKVPGVAPDVLQGSLEVYEPARGVMTIAFPLTQREELLPFDLPPQPDTAGASPASGAGGSSSSASAVSEEDKKTQ